MKYMTKICKVCGLELENLRCDNCKTINLDKEVVDNNQNEKFEDYSYNNYGVISSRIYNLLNKMRGYIFYSESTLSKILNSLFILIIGGRPYGLNFKKDEKMIDIGCGRGDIFKYLPGTWDKTGFDIIDYKITEFRFIVGNFESSDIGHKYSIVRSSHALEHSIYPKLFLDKLINLVDKSGCLVLYTPNSESFCYDLYGSWWDVLHVPSHFYIFGRKYLKQYLENNNFEILYDRSYSTFSLPGTIVSKFTLHGLSFMISFPILIILFLPIEIIIFILNKSDSSVIYARKK